jgi:hypothetical protein
MVERAAFSSVTVAPAIVKPAWSLTVPLIAMVWAEQSAAPRQSAWTIFSIPTKYHHSWCVVSAVFAADLRVPDLLV